jgi:5-(carboxyamino)imidazole ribonucleotide synthase
VKRVLVLGSGQLGLMLAEAASRLGLELDRLDPEKDVLLHGTSPARHGLPRDWSARDYDVVTVEREHFPDRRVVDSLDGHPGWDLARALPCIADRRAQKSLLDDLGVATAEWRHVRQPEDIRRLQRTTGGGVIVKAATGGYDGRGQWRVDNTDSALPPDEHFGRLIAERMVSFERELSLVGARARDGRCVFYPLVENYHHHGMLRCTVAPADVSSIQQRRAESMLSRIMEHLDYVGVMAMECFEEDGALLVNELAPRVHNSGHWSQDGASVDQFELHLRALCALPVTPPRALGTTVMLNLIGTPFDARWLAQDGARLHWYGKSPRPARKLGHVNLNAAEPQAAAGLLRELVAARRADVDAALTVLERNAANHRRTATVRSAGLRN